MEGSTSVERLFGSASALHTFFPDAHPPRTSIQWEGMVRSIFPPRSFFHSLRGFFYELLSHNIPPSHIPFADVNASSRPPPFLSVPLVAPQFQSIRLGGR